MQLESVESRAGRAQSEGPEEDRDRVVARDGPGAARAPLAAATTAEPKDESFEPASETDASRAARAEPAPGMPGLVKSNARMSLTQAVEELERGMIEEALRESSGNLAGAARGLGITERILRYKVNKYDLMPQRLAHRRKR
jgi:transcriptional regulator with GAF, ATPase, and Fis domain